MQYTPENAQDADKSLPIGQILCGDNLDLIRKLPDSSIHLVITSPPYFQQRDYGGGMGNDPEAVDRLVHQIHRQHGCEVIVNGILPSLKYYLRLLSDPKLFLDCYLRNLQLDFKQSTDIKEIHLRFWGELLDSLL